MLLEDFGINSISRGSFKVKPIADNISFIPLSLMLTLETVGIRFQDDFAIFPLKLEPPNFNNCAFIDGAAFSTIIFSCFLMIKSVRLYQFERLETIPLLSSILFDRLVIMAFS